MKSLRAYNNPEIVEYYSSKQKLDYSTALNHFSSMKQFLKFASKTKRQCFPSKELDEIWHTFILFTKDYQAFCKAYLNCFVHHIPFTKEEDKINKFSPGFYCFIENNKFKTKYVRTLTALEATVKSNCGSGGDCTTNCGKCSNGNDD